MHAARNIALCTKDCLCLFVCPTGATDTETGQIDFAKCLDGCRLCVDACPSHAIYLVYDTYAPKPAKDEKLVAALDRLLESKVKQETKASSLADTSKLAKALALSNRILAEQLFISINTVKTHVKNIYSKLDVSNRVQLFSFLRGTTKN